MSSNPVVESSNQQNVNPENILSESTVKSFLQKPYTSINDPRIIRAKEVLQQKGYSITNALGKGGQGVVLEATNSDSLKVAIKLINIQNNNDLILCKKEVDNLIRAKGNHRVIQIYDHFEDDECKIYFLITEFCSGGNLDNYLKKNPNLSQEKIAQIVFEILLGIKQLHENSFIHSDIKPMNVLFTENGSIKLCDLGFAVPKLDPLESKVVAKGYTSAFCAPEQDNNKVGFSSDVYGAGLILLCMCYPGKLSQILKNLKENNNDSPYPKLVDIGLSMIVQETKQRPKIPQVLLMLKPFIGYDKNYDEEFNPSSDFLVEMDQFMEQEFNNFDKEIDQLFQIHEQHY